MNQDIVFELVEIVCTSRFRDLFDDDEFKYILKQIKTKNPDLITAYQNFKLFNDEHELEQALKQAAAQYDKKLTPTKIDVSFENKEKRSSLKKLKKAQKQNNGENKNWNLKTYKGIRKFLREYNQSNVLTIEEASIIVYCAHPSNKNNKEFLDIIDYLDDFSNPDMILKLLKAYGNQISQNIIVKYFEMKESEQINRQKEDILSPVCGAFMNLRALGNIDEFLDILIKNLQCFDQKETSFSNNNPENYQGMSNNNNSNTFNNNVKQQKSAINSTSSCQRDLYQNQQQCQYQNRMSRTEINMQGSQQMEAIPESNEVVEKSNYPKVSYDEEEEEDDNDADNNTQEVKLDPNAQISLFAYSQIAKKKSGERRPTFSLGLNGNNATRIRSDSRRASTKVQNQDQQVIDIIDKFHQAKDQMEFDDRFFEALRKLRNGINLSQKQDVICDKMYYNRYQEFIDILERINNDPYHIKNESNKQQILQLIDSKEKDFDDEEEESPLSKSPKVKYRKDKYLKFKNVLNYLFETRGIISLKEFNTFNFLYTKEDINILSAFEVYSHNSDLQEFISTLKLVDQLYFFKNYLDYDEIEQFDESTNKQLSILFYLKRYISQEQAQVYEKLIRSGDTILIDLYKQFKEKRNKQEFIQKVIYYAQRRKEEIKEAEQRIKEQKAEINTEHQKLTNLIDTFHDRLMQDVHYVEIVYELIDNDNPIMKSISELYDFSKDKQELIQNVTLLYKHHFQKKLQEKAFQALNELKLSRHQELKIKEKIKNQDIILAAAFNAYLEGKDEAEFKDSVKHLSY